MEPEPNCPKAQLQLNKYTIQIYSRTHSPFPYNFLTLQSLSLLSHSTIAFTIYPSLDLVVIVVSLCSMAEDAEDLKFQVHVAPFSYNAKIGDTLGDVKREISRILGKVDLAFDGNWSHSDGEVLTVDDNITATLIKKVKFMVFGEENGVSVIEDVEFDDNFTVSQVKSLLEAVVHIPAAEQEIQFDDKYIMDDDMKVWDLIRDHNVSTLLVERVDSAIVGDNFAPKNRRKP